MGKEIATSRVVQLVGAGAFVHFGSKYGTHGTKRTVGTHGRTHGWSKNAR
jgi:hypothetical protein